MNKKVFLTIIIMIITVTNIILFSNVFHSKGQSTQKSKGNFNRPHYEEEAKEEIEKL